MSCALSPGRRRSVTLAILCFALTSEKGARAEHAPKESRPQPLRVGWLPSYEPSPPRWFIATRLDAGYPFLRPRASFGYGKPHESWVGVDVTPVIGSTDGGGYAGVHAVHPLVDVRTGGTYLYSFNRSFLPEQDTYDRRDVDTRRGDNAQYLAWDSEATLTLPLGALRVISETQLLYLRRVGEGQFLYVAPLGVVTSRGLSVRQRLGLFMDFPTVAFFHIGPIAEFVWVESRAPEVVFRAGVEFHWQLYRELEFLTEIIPVVSSPDTLGFTAGQVLEVRLRWRWATP